MSDPREKYYLRFTSKEVEELSKQLLNYAFENDLTFAQLEAYIYNNDMHREAALLNVRKYRNALRTAINKRFYEKDAEWSEGMPGLERIYARLGYEERYGTKTEQIDLDDGLKNLMKDIKSI